MEIEYMNKRLLIVSAAFFLLTASCASLRDAANVKEPEVTYSDVSIQELSFDGVTLLFDFDVTNPNRVGVSAEGYNYEFFINGTSFLNGQQSEYIEIDGESTARVQVPVSLTYSNVYDSFRSVLSNDTISYKIATDVSFRLPVLGTRRVPVEAEGELPVPRVPNIEFGGFNMKRMSFSGAEAEVSFRVSNPNSFAILLSSADYALQVNGKNWLDTTLGESIRVAGSDSQLITIPVKLSASQMGSALIEMMGGKTEFNYRLTGDAQVAADIRGFNAPQSIPFDLQGILNIDDVR